MSSSLPEIAALFVQKGGVYFGLEGVDPWDESRDARLYAGPHPVVAHPPCSRWCQLAYVVQARYGHKVGDDGGCFETALRSVRTYGGVLEHPAHSLAWPAFGLDRPQRGGWGKSIGEVGWVCEVTQRAYGHEARKRTWLYYVGNSPPEMNWTDPAPIACISYMKNNRPPDLPRLTKRQASRTPLPFRNLLISMARGARSSAAVAA